MVLSLLHSVRWQIIPFVSLVGTSPIAFLNVIDPPGCGPYCSSVTIQFGVYDHIAFNATIVMVSPSIHYFAQIKAHVNQFSYNVRIVTYRYNVDELVTSFEKHDSNLQGNFLAIHYYSSFALVIWYNGGSDESLKKRFDTWHQLRFYAVSANTSRFVKNCTSKYLISFRILSVARQRVALTES